MGLNSVAPYLKLKREGTFLLCRKSNPGGDDFRNQLLAIIEGPPLLYEHVARLAQGPWNLNGQLGLVVSAYPAETERVRAVAPTLPVLIPGMGAQGGDAVATVKAGWRAQKGEASPRSSSTRRAPFCMPRQAIILSMRQASKRKTRDVLQAART